VLETYLLEVLPKYDQERVYISDIKKLFQWYNILHKAGELNKAEEVKDATVENSDSSEKEVKVESTEKKAPAKKAPAKKASEKSSTPKITAKSAGTKKVSAPKSGTSRGK
jgi:hypothetical protein